LPKPVGNSAGMAFIHYDKRTGLHVPPHHVVVVPFRKGWWAVP